MKEKNNKQNHAVETILSRNLSSNTNYSTDLENFLQALNFSEILANNGAKKRSGVPGETIVKDILLTRLDKDSLYMKIEVLKETDYNLSTVYRYLNRKQSDWLMIQTETAKKTFDLISSEAENSDETESEKALAVFIVDDTAYHRSYSEATELASWQYDHAKHEHYRGFRNSSLSYYKNGTLLNLNNVPVSTTDEEKAFRPAQECSENSPAKTRRELTTEKLSEVVFKQIEYAQKVGFEGSHMVCDCWFTFPSFMKKGLDKGLDTIGMIKFNGNTKFEIKGESLTVKEIYEKHAKYLESESKNPDILSSITVTASSEEEKFKVKLLFCNNTSKEGEVISIASTDILLSDDAIARLYAIRWGDEIVFSDFKSPEIDFEHANQSLNLDAIWASIALTGILHLFLTYLASLFLQSSVREAFYHAKAGNQSIKSLDFGLYCLLIAIDGFSRAFELDRDEVTQLIANLFRYNQKALDLESVIYHYKE